MKNNVSQNSTPHHLLIGAGRVSSHLFRYFQMLEISVSQWDRSQGSNKLAELALTASRIWVCITDSAIQKFVTENKEIFEGKTVFHCSGSLKIDGAIGVHPLMTFPSNQFYELNFYRKIPLIVDQKIELAQIDDLLLNPICYLEAHQKTLYHALLVVGGNFPGLLANQVERELAPLGIENSWFRNYFYQSAKNFIDSGESALTGPLVRKDLVVMDANEKALSGKKLQSVYKAMRGLLS